MNELKLHPVDWYNLRGIFKDIFKDDKAVHMKSDKEACYPNPSDLSDSINNPTFVLQDAGGVSVLKENPFDIVKGSIVSKFTILSAVKFKSDNRAAESWVMYKLMELELPYVRVGTTYFKVIPKKNRWGGEEENLTTWKKEVITDDHTKHILRIIPKYDDFVIVPDNKNYTRAFGNCYNLYSPFPHKAHSQPVTPAEIPQSLTVLRHIFGDQIALGIKYMKVLYENPKQMLPIIVLVSKEKGTGKTTFLNWLYILFGQNVTTVNPENLNSEFNSSYAKKNILLFEEMFSEKSAAYQKVMSLTTGKMITLRDLFVSGTSIPFFGKLIFCTNRVKDFMRIDSEENRFWIRYIKPVTSKKNIGIEDDLFKEADKFLRYLEQQPAIDYTQDRLVFTLDDIRTEYLDDVKEESKSGLCKEIEIYVNHFFDNSDHGEFEATAKDIKEKWFSRDPRTSIAYIRKVLHQEMDMYQGKTKRYYPFMPEGLVGELGQELVGIPFTFKRKKPKISTLPDL